MFSYQFSLPYKIDMVFIDGDHRYETVVKDIKKAFELLKPGGLICGHDYDHPNWPGVKQAVDEYVGNVEIEGTIWFKEKS
jgi:predicted O-methyltransferase YrrM